MHIKNRLVYFGCVLCALLCGVLAAPVQAAPQPAITFDAPFLFSYVSWQDKVKIEGGRAILRGEGVTGQGGAGVNAKLDLSANANEYSPALRLKVDANNQVKTLKLLLMDTGERKATYEFELPAPGNDFVLVTPKDGVPLAKPNSIEKGVPDFADIMQWQLIGDWSAGPIDVEVAAVEIIAPGEAITAQRTALAQREAEEQERLRREREELKAKYSKRSPLSPNIEHVSLVAPDVVAIEIQAGRVLPGSVTKHVPQPGDTRNEKKNGDEVSEVILVRGGKEVGWLVGPQREWLTSYEGFEGDPLLEFVADDATNYSVGLINPLASVQPIKPVAVHRKSKPNDWAQGLGQLPVLHTIYLKLPQPLLPGKKYSVMLGEANTRQPSVLLETAAARVRSEAVHVNQIGYRPDDPAKRAFVSCWMGTGGVLTLPDTLNFSLVDDKSGKVVFTGKSERRWPADKPELMGRDVNFNMTDVVRFDFSTFKTPGRYRVAVEGTGCSYPFEIGNNVWRRAFTVQMRGLYHQRSGIALGPPYTTFKKPRDMHPADGYRVTKTKYRSVEGGGEAWAAIPAGDTGEKVPGGWGGYHDAGDWNPRRVSHLRVTLASLEVFEMFPKYFQAVKLNIPPSKGVPDVLTEAMWEFDCFRRLQQKDGGVPYGMESKGDPLAGEVSWLNSYPSYVFTADYTNSWYYAAAGARLARLLQPYDPKTAAIYRQSVLRAFDFAEADWARDTAAGLTQKRDSWNAIDIRNLAALEMYHLTRDKKNHDIFLQNTVLKDPKPELFAWGKAVQRDHAFHYARLPKGLGDESLKKKAVAGVREMADRALVYAGNNAFNVTTPDKGKPQFLGFYSTPDATDLIHAHFLTGDAKYLAGAVQATQFQSGANPGNIVYTTGLGANPIKHPFKMDARRTGQPAPEGLTPYANIDWGKWNDNFTTWPVTWYLSKVATPHPFQWPTHEAYFDVYFFPAMHEWTVDIWAPNVAVWGYLAARK